MINRKKIQSNEGSFNIKYQTTTMKEASINKQRTSFTNQCYAPQIVDFNYVGHPHLINITLISKTRTTKQELISFILIVSAPYRFFILGYFWLRDAGGELRAKTSSLFRVQN